MKSVICLFVSILFLPSLGYANWYTSYDFESKGVVAYFPLDGDSIDASGNGNDGSISGAIPAPGRFGQSYHFDGSSYIQYQEQYAGLSQITYSLWFNADTLYTWPEQQQHTGRMPFKRRGGYADHWPSFWTNRLAITLYDLSYPYSSEEVALPVSTGTWHHLAFGFDGSAMFAYLDGDKVIEAPKDPPLDWSDYYGTFIGHSYDSGSQSDWIGKVDEVAVFDRALSPQEISALSSDSNENDVADFWEHPIQNNGDLVEMVTIPPGSFLMGNSGSDRDIEFGYPYEHPLHPVTISYPFQLGKYEVTNTQFVEVLNWAKGRGFLRNFSNGAYNGGNVYHSGQLICAIVDGTEWYEQSFIKYSGTQFFVGLRNGLDQGNYPVVRITWYGSLAYCNWLSEKEGLSPAYNLSNWTLVNRQGGGYRLPSEAEWEYACRGSVNNPNRYNLFSFGDDTTLNLNTCNHSQFLNPYMVWCGNSNNWSNPVGSRLPNDYGLHDMHGNVYERCEDDWHENYSGAPQDGSPWITPTSQYKLGRGGDWGYHASYCRSSVRDPSGPATLSSRVGFRVARIPTSTTVQFPNLPQGARPLRLVHVPAGAYQLGTPPDERGRETWEKSIQTVVIDQDFWMSDVEVTQAQWASISGVLPTGLADSGLGEGNDYPVYRVSWNQCQNWINSLNNLGLGTFRLPTEAEWEYACRAGMQSRYSFGDNLDCDDACTPCATSETYMWWCGNSAGGAQPVGLKLPNAFGLFDAHGNIAEWCDDFDSNLHGRVQKGGSWNLDADQCRSGSRLGGPEEQKFDNVGFRLVAVLPTPTPPEEVRVPTNVAALGGPVSILVSWVPNSEPNIAGYHVYRDTQPNGAFNQRLNASLITESHFADDTAQSGVVYYYKVSAVSTTGIESQKSIAVQASRGTVKVWMPDFRGPADSEVRLPINVTFATGITGNGMDVKVTYDPLLLTPVEVQKTVLTQSFTFIDNISIANGQINITGISNSGAVIVGEGHILDILFHVEAAASEGTTSPLAFIEVTMYDADATQLSVDYSDTATFTVALDYILGDVDGNGTVNSGDALLAQQVATGEKFPTALELQAGDINGDGVIDSADVTLILRLSVGLPINPEGELKRLKGILNGPDYVVSIGSDEGVHGEVVTIPVEINQMNKVSGVALQVNFDPSILDFQSVAKSPLVESNFLIRSRQIGSSVRITLSSPQPIGSAGGVILYLNFEVVGHPPQSSNLPVASVKLSGEFGENLSWFGTVTGTSGIFGVTTTSGFDGDAWMLYE